MAAAALAVPLAAAAKPDPVQWSATLVRQEADGAIVLSVRAAIENGWYIYSMRQPADGPAPLRFRAPAGSGVAVTGATGPQPRVSYDEGFRQRVGKYYGSPRFTVAMRSVTSADTIPLAVRYQACNDTICLPPRTVTVLASLNAPAR